MNADSVTSEHTLGIDLGTTHSLCAWFTPDGPQLIANSNGSFLTPSIVGVLESGDVVVGAAAKELRIIHPTRTAWCFKRHMGADTKLALAGKNYSAQELSSLVLRSLKQDAEKTLGHPVHDAVITVPAYFNDHQRQATKLAGELAGLNVRRMINEPTAAALVYGYQDREAEKNLCIIDLGGGTFDVTVMEVFEGTLEIRSTAGESHLGGEDFTDRLVAAILKTEGIQLEVAEMKNPLKVARLRNECEVAKRQLSTQDVAKVRVPDENGEVAETTRRFKVTDTQFADLCKPLMRRIAGPISKALRDAELQPEQIDDVILVGGSTRLKVLQTFVHQYFGKAAQMQGNPDEVVALGAAIQAALIEQDRAVDDMVMTDVCPFTMGVEVVKEFGGQLQDGYFQPIIHRNSTIPISREEQFATVQHNQQQVELRIFQGDGRKVEQNTELGKLEVNLPPSPKGSPVLVRFTYDLNGILEVEAYSPTGGQKFRTVLTNHVQGLSQADIQQAIERLAELKFYPREDLANQHLAQYADRMLGEVAANRRQTLDEAIDVFDDAMASSDRQQFEAAKQTLLIVLSGLGVPYDPSGVSEGRIDEDE